MISIESATSPHSFNSLLLLLLPLLLLLLLLLPHLRDLKVSVLRCTGKIPFNFVNTYPFLRKNTFKFRKIISTSTGKKRKFSPRWTCHIRNLKVFFLCGDGKIPLNLEFFFHFLWKKVVHFHS